MLRSRLGVALHLRSATRDQLMSWQQTAWMMGKPAAFDFTVTSPLTSSVTAGSAAFAVEERKHKANDSKCAELPMGVGALKQKWAISQIASRLATRQNCPKSESVTALYQRLSMTLVRANVRALLSRAISDTGY